MVRRDRKLQPCPHALYVAKLLAAAKMAGAGSMVAKVAERQF